VSVSDKAADYLSFRILECILSGGFNINFQMDKNVMQFQNSKGAQASGLKGAEVFA
jgi:hypothetical protein